MREDVTSGDLEARLAALRPEDPVAGLFGPGSVTWRVASRSALFAGAWRAAILQLAHPAVARSIEEHSSTEADPIGRFHRTFQTVFTFLFGDWPRVEAAARALHGLHATITGRVRDGTPAIPAGTPYSANRVEAMTWVLYTLWDTALLVHGELVRPLSIAEQDDYVREGGRFAALFGLDPAAQPRDAASMRADMRRMMTEGPVVVTPTARRLAGFLLRPPNLFGSALWSGPVRTVTGHWMPAPLRADFGFAPDGDRAARRWIGTGRVLLRCLPECLGRVPPYLEAVRRLEGCADSPRWLRVLSRAWLGRERLVLGPTSPGR
jgi:uncharacterized protein (DUF2236 family)